MRSIAISWVEREIEQQEKYMLLFASVKTANLYKHYKVHLWHTIKCRFPLQYLGEGGSIIREGKIVRGEINILLILQLTFYDIRYFEEVT